MRFSQRIGKTPVRTLLQIDNIDDRLKNFLWNGIKEFLTNLETYLHNPVRDRVCKSIWIVHWGFAEDTIPHFQGGSLYFDEFLRYLRSWYYDRAQWYDIYDLVEFIAGLESIRTTEAFLVYCNNVLKAELSAFRIVNGIVVQVTSEEEIESIEEALNESEGLKPVNTHLTKALAMLANRESPDYRNSIKESISAVEALCKIVTGEPKASLGKALAVIESKHNLHGSLKEAYSKLYGYTSDADGIRHALLEDGVAIEFEDAKFMLVSCSSFINYLKIKLNL